VNHRVHLLQYLAEFFLQSQLFREKFIVEIKTHFTFWIFFRNRGSLLGKYGTAIQATDYDILRQGRFACWIIKVTNTHSKYVIYFGFSMATSVTRTLRNITLYTNFLSCIFCF
jgi:hypothetical protein